MVINKIVLNNFNRFSLKGVKHYQYEPTTVMTIFKDKNGVGKSSLMSQLNPLPGDLKKDFSPGGYKEIHLSHKGSEYVLISKDGKHSFKKDDKELNEGGTKKVQLDLVEHEFKINPNRINVINGVSRFTIMSPSERKKWLTEISTIDYSYAISVFNKLTEKKRDIVAWIKLGNEKLLELKQIITEVKDIEDIKQEHEEIKEIIEILLKEYRTTDCPYDYSLLIEDLKTTLRDLYKIDTREINIEKIEKDLLESEVKIKSLTEDRDKKYKDFDKLSNTINKDSYEELQKELSKHNDNIKLFPVSVSIENFTSLNEKIDMAINKVEMFYNILKEKKVMDITSEQNEILKMVPKTIILEDPIENAKNLIETLNMVHSYIRTNTKKEEDILNSINGFTGSYKPRCKKCGEEFNVKEDLSKSEETIKKFKDTEDKVILYLNKIKEYLKGLEEEKQIYHSYKSLFENDIELNKLIDNNIKENIENIYTNIEVLTNFKSILNSKIKISIEEKIKLEKTLLKHSILQEMSSELKATEEKRILLEIENMTKQINGLQDFIKVLKTKKEDVKKFYDLRNKIIETLKKLSVVKNNYKKDYENKCIEEYIKLFKERSIETKKIVENYEQVMVNIQKLEKELKDYKEKITTLSLLIEILSPSSGLIAKSINSFLGVFVNEMNTIINSVWSYKMKILPCDLVEGEDLDYKFKVEINDDYLVEDISKLSSSQQEIVDLAFRLVFIRYLNVGEIPIILDEFGRTMDQEHRINAFNLVDQVISRSYEQIFLVSHFEEMYGRFKNATFASIEE